MKKITVTSRDPPYITAQIKSLLRKKNILMRQGKIGAAGALAKKVGSKIAFSTSSTFSDQRNPIKNTEDLWDRVRSITGKERSTATTVNLSATQLNNHYASVSTDLGYRIPLMKSTAQKYMEYFSEEKVFQLLDTQRNSSPGLDEIPAWFLRISAPALAKPLSELYNISVNSSEVPNQWKSSIITPVAKINKPVNCSDFRPISITPLMSRLLEKLITREFIYPVFEHPELADNFNDQYAYKPTGSTTAAIIKIIHTVAEMLQKHPYVHVIALDFSKAFDSIRHSTLLKKCADLPISDNVYNWLVNYLEHRPLKSLLGGPSGLF